MFSNINVFWFFKYAYDDFNDNESTYQVSGDSSEL